MAYILSDLHGFLRHFDWFDTSTKLSTDKLTTGKAQYRQAHHKSLRTGIDDYNEKGA